MQLLNKDLRYIMNAVEVRQLVETPVRDLRNQLAHNMTQHVIDPLDIESIPQSVNDIVLAAAALLDSVDKNSNPILYIKALSVYRVLDYINRRST